MAVSTPKIRSEVYDCDPLVDREDLVYIAADGLLKRARADDPTTMPAIGWVTRKIGTNRCKITQFRLLEGYEGIESNRNYFVSTTDAGQIQAEPPQDPGHVLQKVGRGVGTDKILLYIDPTSYVVRK